VGVTSAIDVKLPQAMRLVALVVAEPSVDVDASHSDDDDDDEWVAAHGAWRFADEHELKVNDYDFVNNEAQIPVEKLKAAEADKRPKKSAMFLHVPQDAELMRAFLTHRAFRMEHVRSGAVQLLHAAIEAERPLAVRLLVERGLHPNERIESTATSRRPASASRALRRRGGRREVYTVQRTLCWYRTIDVSETRGSLKTLATSST